jgi:hypothetical protein
MSDQIEASIGASLIHEKLRAGRTLIGTKSLRIPRMIWEKPFRQR